jgi:hypothetical protein
MGKLYKVYLTADEVDEINKIFDIVYKHREKVTKKAVENRRHRENVKTRVKKPIKALVFTNDDKLEYITINNKQTPQNSSDTEGSEEIPLPHH